MGAVPETADAGGEATAPGLGVIPRIPIRLGDAARRIGAVGVFQPDQPGAGVGHRSVAIVDADPGQRRSGEQATETKKEQKQPQFHESTSRGVGAHGVRPSTFDAYIYIRKITIPRTGIGYLISGCARQS